MQRIAAPIIGGMITAPLLSMLVIPAAFRLLRRRQCVDYPVRSERLASSVKATPSP